MEDTPDQYDELIAKEHPLAGGDDERYKRALEMVEHRHSKYALIDLVNWLLARAEKAEGHGYQRKDNVVIRGQFNDGEVEVELVRAEADPTAWDIGEYPSLMNWTDAMDIVCGAGYRVRDDGLIEEDVDEAPTSNDAST